jgi:hypothetical protein
MTRRDLIGALAGGLLLAGGARKRTGYTGTPTVQFGPEVTRTLEMTVSCNKRAFDELEARLERMKVEAEELNRKIKGDGREDLSRSSMAELRKLAEGPS